MSELITGGKPNDGTQLIHLPLEAYPDRYTADLAEWEAEAFDNHFGVGRVLHINPPDYTEGAPNETTHQVLNPRRRTIASFTQVRTLLAVLEDLKKAKNTETVIWLSDFFTPGIEAVWYAGYENPIYAMFWAQTVDCFDFTYRNQQLRRCMRKWEDMAMEHYQGIVVASTELKERVIAAWPQHAHKVHCLEGNLPYNSKHIRHKYRFHLDRPMPFADRPYDVAYTSRWAPEKKPGAFLKLLEENSTLKGVMLSGVDTPGSFDLPGDTTLDNRVRILSELGRLEIMGRLSRSDYFGYLRQAKMQLNTSRQDWVSFTLLDALTCGCYPMYPAHRSFPEVFGEDATMFCYAGPDDLHRKVADIIHSIKRGGAGMEGWVTAARLFAKKKLKESDSVLSGLARLVLTQV